MEKMGRELSRNKADFLALLGESADIKKKSMQLGKEKDIACFIAYIGNRRQFSV